MSGDRADLTTEQLQEMLAWASADWASEATSLNVPARTLRPILTELIAAREGGVKVRALEWGKTSYGTPETRTIVGTYRLNQSMAGGWSVIIRSEVLHSADGRVNFPTIDSAKAAAQSHYEADIRSAIVTGEGK